ncbi:hypothetical protein [Laspinema palackyanum]|uniref:hypothetical protein n=1 Tax=Laspinema palackyanum TaxID=3231601 RepID=UPI00345D70BB|nr:hypothetical protein [Laspinema sp. D2c]
MTKQIEQSTLFDLSAFSRPEKNSVGDWGWENESNQPEPETRRFQIGDRIQAKLPNSPEGIIVEIKQGKYPWSDTLLIEWDKGIPRRQKGTRSAISSGKALLWEESYPTETVIEDENLSGKTELSRDEVIALEYKQPDVSLLMLAQKYGISTKEIYDILSDRFGDQLREVNKLKWQEARRQNRPPTLEGEVQEDAEGDRTPAPALFPMEEKYGPVESWPDSPEEEMFDFLSYPTETVIEDSQPSGKTNDIPSNVDSPSYPTEMINRHEDLTGKTIREQILPLSISEKRSLLIWLQETIKDEEWTPPPVKSGRQVVGEPVKTSKGYRRQELVRCGKATCKSCPHGPYWYEYWSEGGKRRSKYVGKNP